jgi:hypothetical protein
VKRWQQRWNCASGRRPPDRAVRGEGSKHLSTKLLESLPLRSAAIGAKVAGLELTMRAPFFVETAGENEVTAQQAGTVCCAASSQNVCVFCEDLPGLGPCSLIAKITRNREGIQREAIKCKRQQGAEMEIYG